MRPSRHRVVVPLAAVAASTMLFACHRGDSILLVEVAGDLRLQPASFQVAVEPAQAAERIFRVTPQGASTGSTVTLPASLSIEMAPNLTGPVVLTVSAFDINGFMIAYGSTTQTDINVGGETIVVVNLTSNFPPPVDAGMDGLPGTGGSGVDSGGAGSPGTGGGGGSPGTGGGAGSPGSGGGAGSGLGGSGGLAGSGAGGLAGSGAGGLAGSAGKGGAGGATGTGGTSGTGGQGGVGGTSGAAGGGGGGGSPGGGSAGSASGGTTGAGGAAGAAAGAGGKVDAGGDA
jgi:hypothetical protein